MTEIKRIKLILTFRQIESDIIPKPLDFRRRSCSCRSAGERHLCRNCHDCDRDGGDDGEQGHCQMMGAIMTKRGSAFSGKLMTAMICMEVMISDMSLGFR